MTVFFCARFFLLQCHSTFGTLARLIGFHFRVHRTNKNRLLLFRICLWFSCCCLFRFGCRRSVVVMLIFSWLLHLTLIVVVSCTMFMSCISRYCLFKFLSLIGRERRQLSEESNNLFDFGWLVSLGKPWHCRSLNAPLDNPR